MPILSKLPSGGGGSAEVGISNGQGIVKLNVFTQPTEPTKKDGIWIKTNNQYQKIMINQPTINNYEDTTIVKLGIIPFDMGIFAFSFVYNGYLYAASGNSKTLYRYNSTWTDTGIAYHNWNRSNPIVYNNKVHIFTFDNYSHYVFDGQSLTRISDNDLGEGMANSDDYYAGSVFVYNNNLYYNSYYHKVDNAYVSIYIYDEANKNWNYKRNTNGMYGGSGETCVYNGLVYIIGGYKSETPYSSECYDRTDLYTYDGSRFENICKLPHQVPPDTTMFVYNNMIYICSAHKRDNNNLDIEIFIYNGSTFTKCSYTINNIENLYEVSKNCILVYNGEIHMLVSLNIDDGSPHYHYVFRSASKVYDPNTVILYRGETGNGTYLTAIADTSAIIDDGNNNNRFISGFDDAVYFANTAFDWNAPMYYGDGTKWIKFKN